MRNYKIIQEKLKEWEIMTEKWSSGKNICFLDDFSWNYGKILLNPIDNYISNIVCSKCNKSFYRKKTNYNFTGKPVCFSCKYRVKKSHSRKIEYEMAQKLVN